MHVSKKQSVEAVFRKRRLEKKSGAKVVKYKYTAVKRTTEVAIKYGILPEMAVPFARQFYKQGKYRFGYEM